MDPVTRIEGHMKVEVVIDSNGGQQQVVDARCTGTLFRGFETLLNGRNPLDGPIITPANLWGLPDITWAGSGAGVGECFGMATVRQCQVAAKSDTGRKFSAVTYPAFLSPCRSGLC